MNELIRQIKVSALEQLKQKRNEVESKKSTIAAQKYAEKKANVNLEVEKLNGTLNLAIKQIQEEANKKIAVLRTEVAEKIANYDVTAKAEADAEAEAEVAHALRDFDEEITKLEKELA